MDHDLSKAELAELRRINANYPCEVDYQAFKGLWERRLVMAGPKDTFITARGRLILQRLDETRSG